MFYEDFESILVLEDNRKQNLNESYTNKYQKHVVCSYGYKIVCVVDKVSNLTISYLGEDAVKIFMSSMIKEIKYSSVPKWKGWRMGKGEMMGVGWRKCTSGKVIKIS